MRKLTLVGLAVLLAIVAWRAVPSTINGRADGTPRPIGSYAFSEAIHDPIEGSSPGTGQEGTAVGTLTLDGNGNLKGVYTQNTRGCSIATCGDLEVTRAPITGTYSVYADGSATLDLCLTIGLGNLPVGGTPQQVEAIWEGSFSLLFAHFRYTQ